MTNKPRQQLRVPSYVIHLCLLTFLLFFSAFTSASTTCHLYTTSYHPEPFHEQYGVPWDVFSLSAEPLVRSSCDTNRLKISSGKQSQNVFVWHKGYYTDSNNTWKDFTFQGDNLREGYFIGEAHIELDIPQSLIDNGMYIIAYTCIDIGNGQWKCGCRTSDCPGDYGQQLWQLQRVVSTVEFRKPVTDYSQTQGYACLDCIGNGKYHAGIDLDAITPTNLDIKASAIGIVHKRQPYDGVNDHGLGNTIILKHPSPDGGHLFSLYAHLSEFNAAITVGKEVNEGQVIGKMGQTGNGVEGVHLHFELKAWGVLGNLSDEGLHWGYTPGIPNWFGYLNPNPYVDHPLNLNFHSFPVAVQNHQEILTGPNPDVYHLNLATVSPGQYYVAFNETNGWYQIYLPSSIGPASGWIQGAKELTVKAIVVNDPNPAQNVSGVNVRAQPNTTSTPLTKVWDRQKFVLTDNTSTHGQGCANAWYEIHLPDNTAQTSGWVCGEFLKAL